MAEFLAHLVVLFCVYATLIYAFNLLAGDGGLLAFCFGGIWGIGAYAAALGSLARGSAPYIDELSVSAGAGLELTLPLAAMSGALTGLITGLGSLRFRGDTFILATLAMQVLIVGALENMTGITRGAAGLYGIPEPVLFGHPLPLPGLALLACALTVLSALLLVRLRGSAFGVQLRALRDHERAARALGVPPTWRYLCAFVVAGGFAGLAGGLYVARATYIDPSSFGLPESILIVTALLLGGRGTILGPLIGTLVIVGLPEVIRFIGLGIVQAAALRSIMMALLLIGIVLLRPRGLASGGHR